MERPHGVIHLDGETLALAVQLSKDHAASDPIRTMQFSSPQLRDATKLVAREIETRVRSGNSAGKTSWGAWLGTCLARGIRQVDGRTIHEVRDGAEPFMFDLPRVQVPNLGLLAVSSYKQSSESSIAAYRRMIGAVPHRMIRTSQGVSEIRIKPDLVQSDDDEDWSKILVFPIDGALPEGIRAHWAQADETPGEEMWREVRMRVIAGLPYFRWITDTPKRRSLWTWLARERERPADWRQEVRLHVRDNQALSRRDIKRIIDLAAGDPLERACLDGSEVNTDGTNPLYGYQDLLDRLLAACRNPIREETLNVPGADQSGRIVDGYGVLYIWEDPVPGEEYGIPSDVSLGVPDGNHDPCGFHVYARGVKGRRRMVARYNGYLGSYGLGSLAALIGERYNDAELDPDMTGGYGQPYLMATSAYRSKRWPNGYGRIARDLVVDAGGSRWKQPYGHVLTGKGKSAYVEPIKWALGLGMVDVPSAATIRCLQDAVMDDRQRLVKTAGVHYEDWDNLGRECERIFRLEGGEVSRYDQQTAGERFAERLGLPAPFAGRRDGYRSPVEDLTWGLGS